MAPSKAAPGNTGRADRRQREVLVSPGGCAPVLAHVPSVWRNPGVHRTSWCIPFPRHACMFLVLGSPALGCRTLRLESQSSAGLRMQPYPRAPDLVWPGHLHGTGCLSARAMDTGFPIVVWCLCFGLGSAVTLPFLAVVWGACAWPRVSALPRYFWLRFVVCAFWGWVWR